MQTFNFSGNTFVAFVDVCGFKTMMKESEERVYRVLNAFYQVGYDVLRKSRNHINGIFVSDCGILFSREGGQQEQLENLLQVVKVINRRMLGDDVMLTTNIAYGSFRYENRIEFIGIEKNMIYGNAYLSAYLDSLANPKMEAGQCRILINNISREILDSNEFLKTQGRKHYYYYWNIDDSEKIESFKKAYKNSKYKGILEVLKSTDFNY